MVKTPAKVTHIILLMFFNENEINSVKISIPSNIKNHITIAISVQEYQLDIFSKLCSRSIQTHCVVAVERHSGKCGEVLTVGDTTE